MSAARDAILNAQDHKIVKVEIPEWPGAEFYVRTMSGADRGAFEEARLSADGKNKMKDFYAHLAVMVLCDADGHRLFSMADLPLIQERNATALVRICEVAAPLNGLTSKDVEDLGKGSAAPTGGNSASA